MMLGNTQQGERLLDDTLKEGKDRYRQLVEMKEKGEHQTSTAAHVGLLGRIG